MPVRTWSKLVLLVVAFAVSPRFIIAAPLDMYVIDHNGKQILRYDGITGVYKGVYISGSSLSVYNTPFGIDSSLDGSIVYATEYTGRMYRFDYATGANLDGGNPFIHTLSSFYGVTVDASGNLLNGTDDRVLRWTAAGAPLPGSGEGGANFSESLGGRPRHTAQGPDGFIYVSQTDQATSPGNQIYKLNPTTGNLDSVFADLDAATGANPEALDLTWGPSFNIGGTPDLYVTTFGFSGSPLSEVRVFEGTSGSLVGTISMPTNTWGLSGIKFNENAGLGNQMIVTSFNGNGSRAYLINGIGGVTDQLAFLSGGPGGNVPSNLQTFIFLPEPGAATLLLAGVCGFMRRRRGCI